MKILISNDDGIDSPGIRELARAMATIGDVTVVAPERERSTAGHSLTLHKPLRIHALEKGFYSTSGTPADCIYLGIREVMKERPDLIVSGINRGANLGTDVHYSGTVAAAREGALMNIPSYAFSLVDWRQLFPESAPEPLRFDVAAEMAKEVVLATKGLTFPKHTLLNVNIPNLERSEVKGFRIARQGIRYYQNEVAKRQDPRHRDYFWIGGGYLGFEPNPDSDCEAVNAKLVAVTPITIDCTHTDFHKQLREKFPHWS